MWPKVEGPSAVEAASDKATGSGANGHRSADLRGGRGRGRASGPPPQATASSQPPLTAPASSQPPLLASSQPIPAAAASQPPPIAPTFSQPPPLASSQPIPIAAQPRVRVFGVRRSGRLKLAVRRPQNQPPEQIDLTLD
ncbi:hypothetical protein PIB30_071969 [Stylosanthes scabra]|uniref:Uncharacterized protein n=1 Tax=Stylosanthes scabra TaxID=79078 RepID=A0ABU6QNI4_9FABA|nr:hypothetical protein [Stylosanthes scabra]